MWETSQQTPSCSKFPMSLLKNFDSHEILEPQKICHREQKLIDIEPDESEICINVAASDLNILMPKRDPDLIDLFENIYVSPQHIEEKKENDKKIKEQIEQNLRQISEWSKNDKQSTKVVDKCINCLSNINNVEENDTPKVLVPPTLLLKRNSQKNHDNLIDKTLEFNTQKKENVNTTFQNTTQSLYFDLEHFQQSNHNDDLEDHESLCDEILQSKSFEKYFKEQNETCAQNTPRPLIPKTHSKVFLKSSQNNPNTDLIKNNSMKDINESLHTDKKVKLLDTVKKDEKLYLKRRIIKGDAVKSYTKGPDLQEKSIVMPQLIERLKMSEKVLEERKVVKRRLVLDMGSSKSYVEKTNSYHTPSLLNPVVLMEDCNRERLIGFKTREAFDKFIRTGKFK